MQKNKELTTDSQYRDLIRLASVFQNNINSLIANALKEMQECYSSLIGKRVLIKIAGRKEPLDCYLTAYEMKGADISLRVVHTLKTGEMGEYWQRIPVISIAGITFKYVTNEALYERNS